MFYEHVKYFRLSDSFSFFGGQYLYVVADLGPLCMDNPGDVQEFHLSLDFLEGIDRATASIRS